MTHSDVDILNELHYLVPFWVKKDFVRTARACGDLSDDRNLHQLVELMFSNQLAGTFWRTGMPFEQEGRRGRIDDLVPDELEKRLGETDRSFRSILACLMHEHAKAVGCTRYGAKFPVNIEYTGKLARWFPGCRIIHLVRDPRAIYTSMIKMSIKRSEVGILRKEGPAQLARLFYAIQQFRQAARVHATFSGERGYLLLRFEDLVRSPEAMIEAMCKFADLDFLPEMLSPPTGVGSNYDEKKAGVSGFDADALERWKVHIPGFGRRIIEHGLRKQMEMFAYE